MKHDFETKNCIFYPKKATLIMLGQILGYGATKWAGALNLEWSKFALGYEQDMIALVWVTPIKKQARKSSEDTHFTGYARFEKVWAR